MAYPTTHLSASTHPRSVRYSRWMACQHSHVSLLHVFRDNLDVVLLHALKEQRHIMDFLARHYSQAHAPVLFMERHQDPTALATSL